MFRSEDGPALSPSAWHPANGAGNAAMNFRIRTVVPPRANFAVLLRISQTPRVVHGRFVPRHSAGEWRDVAKTGHKCPVLEYRFKENTLFKYDQTGHECPVCLSFQIREGFSLLLTEWHTEVWRPGIAKLAECR
jgi:hypothetical protein